MTEVKPWFLYFYFRLLNTRDRSRRGADGLGGFVSLRGNLHLFYPICPPRKMRNLVSRVSEPPVSANRFPNEVQLRKSTEQPVSRCHQFEAQRCPRNTTWRSATLVPRGLPTGQPRGCKDTPPFLLRVI
ncbi:hypothetical protein NPIL_68471, partial [Nephila pilipes]